MHRANGKKGLLPLTIFFVTGSSLHYLKVLSNPRWEDYSYKSINDNDAAWLGNGWTVAERTTTDDRAYYLDEENIDFPPIPKDVSQQENGHATKV